MSDNPAESEKKMSVSEPKAKSKVKKRIHTLDELRGLAVFCMIFYHAFYSMGVFFNFKFGTDLTNFFMPAEPYFAALFIFISGISSNLTHSNLERGCKLFFISYALTIVTFFVVGPENMIRFGILHMLSVSMIAYGLLTKVNSLIPMWIGAAVNIILFVITFNITSGSIGIPFLFSYRLPAEWYNSGVFYMFGLPDKNFVSSDYFPLMPWFFLFFAGGFIGRLAANKKFPKFTYKKHIPFLAFLGRHALIIYLAHQPVIFGICYLIQLITNSPAPQA